VQEIIKAYQRHNEKPRQSPPRRQS